MDQGVMIQKIYNGYVREIFFHVYKEGVDLQNSKKFIKKISKSICTQKIFQLFKKHMYTKILMLFKKHMYTKNYFQKAYVHKNFIAFQKAYVHKKNFFQKAMDDFQKAVDDFQKAVDDFQKAVKKINSGKMESNI